MRGEEIGSVLRMCRIKAGLSQESLARCLHRDRSYISRVENGHEIPDIIEVLKWAEVTDSQKIIAILLSGQDNWYQLVQDLFKYQQLKELLLEPIA